MTINLERILDTTLREGTQTPSVIFSSDECRKISEKLYFILERRGHMGSFIEIGHPYSPEIRRQVESVANHFKEMSYDNVTLVSHCRTLRSDADIAWKIERDLKNPGICVFMATSDKHLLHKLEKSYEEALKIIEDVVDYCKHELGFSTVEYTAEDATSTPLERLMEIADIVEAAGADVYRVADTKGQMLPSEFGRLIKGLAENTTIPLDLHCHNDLHLGMANLVSGLEAGGTGIHTTVLGLGERVGITPLSGAVAVLETKYDVDTKVNKEKLYDLCKYVSAVSGLRVPENFPVIGDNAFTHKAGTHQKAVLKDPSIYETLRPEDYGRDRKFEIGVMVSKELIRKMFNVNRERADTIAIRLREYSAKKRNRPLRKGEVVRLLIEEFGVTGDIKYLNEGFSGIVGISTDTRYFSGDVAHKIATISLEGDYSISRVFDVTGDSDLIIIIENCKDKEMFDRVLNEIRKIEGVQKTNTMTILDEF